MALPRFNADQVPALAGRASATDHVLGVSQRDAKYSMGTGTNAKLYGGNDTKDYKKDPNREAAPQKTAIKAFTFGIGKKLMP